MFLQIFIAGVVIFSAVVYLCLYIRDLKHEAQHTKDLLEINNDLIGERDEVVRKLQEENNRLRLESKLLKERVL